MQAGRGAAPGPEQLVERGNRAAANQGKGAATFTLQSLQQRRQMRRHAHGFRMGGDLKQRAVDIDEEGRIRIERWRLEELCHLVRRFGRSAAILLCAAHIGLENRCPKLCQKPEAAAIFGRGVDAAAAHP
jgi:hypothetical protein